MIKKDKEKLREIVSVFDLHINDREYALNLLKAPYMKGGSKEGQEYHPIDNGHIAKAADALATWVQAKAMITSAFPEIFLEHKKEQG